MKSSKLKNVSLSYIKLGIAISETDQSVKEFNAIVESIRNRYSFIGRILYKMGIL